MDEITKKVIDMVEELKAKGVKGYYDIVARTINEEYRRSYSGATICTKYNIAKKKQATQAQAIPEEVTQNPNVDYKETTEIFSDGRQVSDKLLKMSEEETKSPEYLMKAHGYDSALWELVSARNNIWNTYSKQDGIQVLYSSKITVKPLGKAFGKEDLLQHLLQFDREYKAPTIIKRQATKDVYLLDFPIMDLHFGKLGWAPETGENYDHKIAEERFLYCIDDIIRKAKPYQIEKVLFPIGNDFFNSDDSEGNTTGGTRQDNDLRWRKMYKKGIEVLVKGIDMLETVCGNVEVIEVAGNHDKMTSFYAECNLFAWYRNQPNIIISEDVYPRKYIEYGNSLIGYAHGKDEGARIGTLMQSEAREAWGRTKYHEWHLGHIHSEKILGENKHSLNIRHISSVCGTDAWHADSGYTGAIKKAQAFLWHKEYGLEAIINSVIK